MVPDIRGYTKYLMLAYTVALFGIPHPWPETYLFRACNTFAITILKFIKKKKFNSKNFFYHYFESHMKGNLQFRIFLH